MIDILGTLGPGCDDKETMTQMFAAGMTGIRINLSHTSLLDCKDKIKMIQSAALSKGVTAKILIDLQGPELRIQKLKNPIPLIEGESFVFGDDGVPVDEKLLEKMTAGTEVLLDDGKIMVRIEHMGESGCRARVLRSGILHSGKSIALVGVDVDMPALTARDRENLSYAKDLGVTGVMQPFVRSREDLIEVRTALLEQGCDDIRLYAKIENHFGVENLSSFFELCDEIVIARGDLGNSMPLWELPRVQKQIAKECRACHMPFMVVTQMLSSMEHAKVPTRAEVSDIYNAVLDGASSVMVTGETAVGEYPAEVIHYLRKTAEEALRNLKF